MHKHITITGGNLISEIQGSKTPSTGDMCVKDFVIHFQNASQIKQHLSQSIEQIHCLSLNYIDLSTGARQVLWLHFNDLYTPAPENRLQVYTSLGLNAAPGHACIPFWTNSHTLIEPIHLNTFKYNEGAIKEINLRVTDASGTPVNVEGILILRAIVGRWQ